MPANPSADTKFQNSGPFPYSSRYFRIASQLARSLFTYRRTFTNFAILLTATLLQITAAMSTANPVDYRGVYAFFT